MKASWASNMFGEKRKFQAYLGLTAQISSNFFWSMQKRVSVMFREILPSCSLLLNGRMHNVQKFIKGILMQHSGNMDAK